MTSASPSDFCRCGHVRLRHEGGTGKCQPDPGRGTCACKVFRIAPQGLAGCPLDQYEATAASIVGVLYEARGEWPMFSACAIPIARPHYGLKVIEEELQELRDLVYAWKPKRDREAQLAKMRWEALQVAAMALAFVTEICYADDAKD